MTSRIIVNTYMVAYPRGGLLSLFLHWIVGLHRLGHEVFIIEKAAGPDACLDPRKKGRSNDFSYGLDQVRRHLSKFDLSERHCFVDHTGAHHGLSEADLAAVFRSADLFVDVRGPGKEWLPETDAAGVTTVVIDGEPGSNQIWLDNMKSDGYELPRYDHYYTIGLNVGTHKYHGPTAELAWRHVPMPVVTDLYRVTPSRPEAPFTTVMNWQKSSSPICARANGRTYGHKDMEFEKFMHLPRRTSAPLEVAVSGRRVPVDRLREAGWAIRDGDRTTLTVESFRSYIEASRGEFSVASNVYVETNGGWFPDRSGAYLSSGRPVVLQEAGFGEYLPSGRGLFSVRSVDEAAAAIEEIRRDYDRQSRWAVELAREYLEAEKILGKFLSEFGL